MKTKIGITERGDAALDTSWYTWVVEEKKPAILISKDPLKLYDHLKDLKDINVIVHTTITGFGSTIIEPKVPEVSNALEGFEKLCKFLGPERIVLRIDPVVPTERGIETACSVLKKAKKISTTRVRISFIDLYDHVKKGFASKGIQLEWDSFHAPLLLRKKAWERLENPEVCGEPSFACSGCISEIDCEILKVDPIDKMFFQRKSCACLGNKKELLSCRSQCAHECLYCYWQKLSL